MAKDPAVLLYIDNWLVSTKEMRADERGWYLNLILHQYDKGDLPNDIEELANLCDVRMSEFESFKAKWGQVLKHKFKQNNKGRLENDKAAEILRKREQFKEKRSESGKIGYVIKFAMAELKATREECEYIKTNFNFNNIDLKNEQMLKQVLKQTLKLYINGDGNKDKDLNKNENLKEEKNVCVLIDENKEIFREVLKLYPGVKKGIDTEYINFQKKHKDWKEINATLIDKLENQIFIRAQSTGFMPNWAHFSTWINQRKFEEELIITKDEKINKAEQRFATFANLGHSLRDED